MKNIGFFLLKLAVTAGVLWLLVSAVDVGAVKARVSAVPAWAFCYAVICYMLSVYFSTIRWNVLLRAEGIQLPLRRLLAYNFSYNFYTAALPGGKLAAEAIRLYQIIADSKDEGIRMKIFVPTLLDRAIVIISSAAVSVLFFIFISQSDVSLPGWLPYVGIGALLVVVATAFLPIERLFTRARTDAPQRSMVRSFIEALKTYRDRPLLLLYVAFLSLAMNAVIASGIYALAMSLSIAVSFILVFAVFCVGMVTAFVPITIAGIGVREGAFAYLLALAANVPLAATVSLSLVALAAFLSTVAVGGIVEFHRHFLMRKP